MKAWLIRIAALLAFAVSFALPAVRMGSDSSAHAIPGWTCAAFASVLAPKALVQSIGQGVRFEDALIPVSGLINDLFLLVIVLSSWRRLVRTRLIVGALMIPCFVATWMFFGSQKVTPLAGHYLWVAGAVLLLVPDLASLFFSRRTTAAAEREPADRTQVSP